MIKSLFGKYAGIASGVVITVIAIIQVAKPDLLGTDVAVTLMSILGVHAVASDSPVKAVK